MKYLTRKSECVKELNQTKVLKATHEPAVNCSVKFKFLSSINSPIGFDSRREHWSTGGFWCE